MRYGNNLRWAHGVVCAALRDLRQGDPEMAEHRLEEVVSDSEEEEEDSYDCDDSQVAAVKDVSAKEWAELPVFFSVARALVHLHAAPWGGERRGSRTILPAQERS